MEINVFSPGLFVWSVVCLLFLAAIVYLMIRVTRNQNRK